jgi:3-oxoacyl-[acyl-carrier-protein] synthase II
MSRFSQFSLVSAIEAMKDAGLDINENNRYRVAVAVGTGLASTDSTDKFYEGLLRDGPEGTNPILFPETVQNIAAAHISMHFGTRGQNITFSHADISSELALYYACELLNDGLTDIAIVSGADELSATELAGYSGFNVLSNDMGPFDKKRNGFVLGEGGATIILERKEDADKRGAKAYCTIGAAEITSYPALITSYDKSRESMKKAMLTALTKAGLKIPGFTSACANSTSDLDQLEAESIRELFGHTVPVTAFRSYNGYFPADGVLRVASTALCLNRAIVPAIAGLINPMDGCGLDLVIGHPRPLHADSALITSFSTGGSAASIVLKHEV